MRAQLLKYFFAQKPCLLCVYKTFKYKMYRIDIQLYFYLIFLLETLLDLENNNFVKTYLLENNSVNVVG